MSESARSGLDADAESPAEDDHAETEAARVGGRGTEPLAASATKIIDQRRSGPPMTKEAWIARELAKRPARSAKWRREMLAWWGLRPSDPVDIDQLGIELPPASAGGVDENRPDVAA